MHLTEHALVLRSLPASGRIQYTLATEIYGIPQCRTSLLDGIASFRNAIQSTPDSIDAAYNLAQALQTLGEWIIHSDGGGSSNSAIGQYLAVSVLTEARTLLQQVERAQSEQLQHEPSHSTTQSLQDDQDSPSSPADSSSEQTALETAMVEEIQVVTPSSIIETILTAIDVDLSLLPISPDPDSIAQDIDHLLARACSLDAEKGTMANDITKSRAEAVCVILQNQSDRHATPNLHPLQDLATQMAQKIEADTGKAIHPEDLTEVADTLIALASLKVLQLARPDELHACIEIVSQAIVYYSRAEAVLSSPLNRPAGLKTHHIASLQSSTALSMSGAHLLRSLLTGAAIASNATVPADASAMAADLTSASTAALTALDVVGGPIKTSDRSTVQQPRFVRRLPRSDARTDYRTIDATQEAALGILSAYTASSCIDGGAVPEDTFKSLSGLIGAVWVDKQARQAALSSWMEDLDESAVAKLLQSMAASERFGEVVKRFVAL